LKKISIILLFIIFAFLLSSIQPLRANDPYLQNTSDNNDCPEDDSSKSSKDPGSPDKGKNEEKCCSCQKKNENTSANQGQSAAKKDNSSGKCNKNSSGDGNDNGKKKDECENGPANESLDLTVPFGRVINEGAFTNGKLTIYKEQPSLTVFSPQGLFFSHALSRRILFDMTSGVPEGYSRKVVIPDTAAKRIGYYFKTGESIAWPARTGTTSEDRLYMLDASGAQTLEQGRERICTNCLAQRPDRQASDRTGPIAKSEPHPDGPRRKDPRSEAAELFSDGTHGNPCP